MSKRFWVIGGNAAGSDRQPSPDGAREHRYGPFGRYEEAKAEWQRRAWESADQANLRFRIEEEAEDVRYWVVGGPYTDAGFVEPAAGGGEQWFGPFADYDSAKIEWSRRAWASANDVMCCYRIEKLSAHERPGSLAEAVAGIEPGKAGIRRI
jgi:hypothetical protein